jgi:hypothetical protein
MKCASLCVAPFRLATRLQPNARRNPTNGFAANSSESRAMFA